MSVTLAVFQPAMSPLYAFPYSLGPPFGPLGVCLRSSANVVGGGELGGGERANRNVDQVPPIPSSFSSNASVLGVQTYRASTRARAM